MTTRQPLLVDPLDSQEIVLRVLRDVRAEIDRGHAVRMVRVHPADHEQLLIAQFRNDPERRYIVSIEPGGDEYLSLEIRDRDGVRLVHGYDVPQGTTKVVVSGRNNHTRQDPTP